jgi:hypothetical protein
MDSLCFHHISNIQHGLCRWLYLQKKTQLGAYVFLNSGFNVFLRPGFFQTSIKFPDINNTFDKEVQEIGELLLIANYKYRSKQ